MAAVEGRYLTLAKALHDREHRSVHEAEPKVCVGTQQSADPDVVAGLQLLDHERPAVHVVQEARERSEGDEVIEFDDHGGRDKPDAGPAPKQLRTREVVLVVGIQQRDERPGVNYERNGGGS